MIWLHAIVSGPRQRIRRFNRIFTEKPILEDETTCPKGEKAPDTR